MGGIGRYLTETGARGVGHDLDLLEDANQGAKRQEYEGVEFRQDGRHLADENQVCVVDNTPGALFGSRN